MIVGIIGIILPIIFIIGEAFFLRGGVEIRGSLSAYYHTPMHDFFVAGLCVIGFFLAVYLVGRSSQDFWFSLVAGVAVLGVVFFPKQRPNLAEDALKCGDPSMPQGCSPIQQWLGEGRVAAIHFVCAAVFIVCLAWICLLFAKSEWEHNKKRGGVGLTWRVAIFCICAALIVVAIAWAIIGLSLNVAGIELTRLYVAEVASVWAFAAAWFVQSLDLIPRLRRPVTVGEQIVPLSAAPPR
jgi:hypothetical protein